MVTRSIVKAELSLAGTWSHQMINKHTSNCFLPLSWSPGLGTLVVCSVLSGISCLCRLATADDAPHRSAHLEEESSEEDENETEEERGKSV